MKRQMIAQGIAPICGATLPGGPVTSDSRCRAQGLRVDASLDGSGLHLDHEPPLRLDERSQQRAVCDPRRVQFLCADCHRSKTRRQQ